MNRPSPDETPRRSLESDLPQSSNEQQTFEMGSGYDDSRPGDIFNIYFFELPQLVSFTVANSLKPSSGVAMGLLRACAPKIWLLFKILILYR